jgi:hypothetical protein
LFQSRAVKGSGAISGPLPAAFHHPAAGRTWEDSLSAMTITAMISNTPMSIDNQRRSSVEFAMLSPSPLAQRISGYAT